MSEYLPFIVVGISTGSIYALAAMGLVLTYKTSGVFNFAHGAQAALGAYLMYWLWAENGWPWPLAALTAVLLGGVVAGLLLERLAQALAAVSVAARVGATVGLLVAVQGALQALFGGEARAMDFFLPDRVVSIGDVSIRIEQIIVVVVVAVAALVLWLFLNKSRLGAATQAVVDDPSLLQLQGVSPARVRRAAWVTGSCFAAASGMLLAPTTGLEAGILTLLVFYAFGAAAVGAFTSLPLCYAGGISIGIAAAILTKVLSGTGGELASLPSTLPFLVLVVALLVTPKARLMQRGQSSIRRELAPYRLDRRTRPLVGVAAALGLLVLPHLVGGPRVSLYLTALAFVTLFASLGLLVRTSGQISLCQMTFAAVGAMTMARTTEAGVPWLVAVLLGGLAAVPAGALIAIPAIRLSGVYLAIATFGFALLVQNLLFPSPLFFDDFTELLVAPRPSFAESDTAYYYVLLAITVMCCALVVAVGRGRFGRFLHGLRDAPIALDAHGANANLTRLWVFCISAFLAGIAGATLAPVTGSVSPTPYAFTVSLLLVSVLFLAGRQPILGPVIAAVAFVVVPGYIESDDLQKYLPVLFGMGAVIGATAGGIPLASKLAGAKRTRQRQTRPLRRLSQASPQKVPA